MERLAATWWDAVRDGLYDTVLDWRLYAFGLVPCLVLERAFAAHRRARWVTPNLVYDFLNGAFDLVFSLGLNVLLTVWIANAYRRYLGFLDVGLLDDTPFPVQVIGAFLAYDFMSYAVHVARHKVPVLWHFHAIHHSQRDLNPFTTNRGHLVEDIVLLVARTLPLGIVGGTYPAWAAFAAIDLFWGYFQHANIRTNLGPLGYVLVSPQSHRIHHSIEPAHIDHNYGERLALWDHLFGTAHPDRTSYPETGVTDELPAERSLALSSLVRCWLANAVYPFRAIRAARPTAAREP